MIKNWAITVLLLSLSQLHTALAADDVTDTRRDLPFPALVEYDGYEVETHTVTTPDGYVLTMYRLPRNASCPQDDARLPLVFMHGLYLSSDDCIIPGPGKAHCYIYSDACHDVWVPNVRGNRYSRNHVSLNPDKDNQYWDFALDEMALIDLPAFIDYVLDHTGKKQVNYVAHSQGVGIAILLCAKKPEYNDKIKAGFGLSVTAYLNKSRFAVILIQEAVSGAANSKLSNFEILAHGKIAQSAGKVLCGTTDATYPFCSLLLFAALGYNKFQITDETFRTLTGHVPAGTSFKNFARWGQMKKYGFCEEDLGTITNLRTYRRLSPPLFDLSAVSMPWYFIASENDYVGDVRDIKTLEKKLSNVQTCILADKTFGHLDFIYGKDIVNYITPKILSVIDGKEFKCDSS